MIVKILRTGVRDQGKKWEESSFREGYPTYEEFGLLYKLNSIIEWNFVKYPKKQGEDVEDKNYLAPDNILQPGDAFSLGESGNLQLIRVISEDKIGLEHTETGGLALDRIVNSIISPEIKMFFNNSIGVSGITFEKFDWEKVPESHGWEYKIPYDLYKIFSDRFFPKRDEFLGGMKITIETDMSVFPIECYLYKSNMKFNEDDVIEKEFIDELVKDMLAWFYNNHERLEVIEKSENIYQNQNKEDLLRNLINTVSVSTGNQQSSNTQSNINNYDVEDFGEFNPDEIYHYSVKGEEGELILYLVKKSFWDSEGYMDSEHLDPRFEDMYISEFESACEGTYMVPDKFKTKEEVYSYLSSIHVFEFSQDFENFIYNCD